MWEKRRENEFDQYEQYLRRELPGAVRRRLEEAVAYSRGQLKANSGADLLILSEIRNRNFSVSSGKQPTAERSW